VLAVQVDRRFLKRLQTLGIIEGVSTLVLFGVAMPLKYLAGMPLAVTLVGAIHGLLFTTLAAMFLFGMKRIPISRSLAAIGIVAAIFPFGPFMMHSRLGRVAEPVNSPVA
jgi:integral membrane protein